MRGGGWWAGFWYRREWGKGTWLERAVRGRRRRRKMTDAKADDRPEGRSDGDRLDFILWGGECV